jgi:hypothetical protein
VTLRWDGEAILLEGECPADEAEALLELILAHPAAPIDWSRCRSAHTAVVQVLLAAGQPLRGLPEDDFLRRWTLPQLAVLLGT